MLRTPTVASKTDTEVRRDVDMDEAVRSGVRGHGEVGDVGRPACAVRVGAEAMPRVFEGCDAAAGRRRSVPHYPHLLRPVNSPAPSDCQAGDLDGSHDEAQESRSDTVRCGSTPQRQR